MKRLDASKETKIKIVEFFLKHSIPKLLKEEKHATTDKS